MLEAIGLCPTGIPVVGTACGAVSGAVSAAAGKVADAGVDAVFSAAANWVSSGAVWLLQEVGRVMSTTTSVDLGAPWFVAHEAVMASLAAAVVLPMVCCAVIQAIYRQSASTLVRTFAVYLPLCLLFTGVAVSLVRIALSITDSLSATVLSGAGVDTTNMFSGLTKFFAASGAVAGPAVPAFVVFIGALLVALGALVLWLELAVRAAAVTAAALFLPLAMAALVWPAVSHWCRRLADTLVALVLSKFVIAAVLSLAASALAGGLGLSGAGGGGFAAVVTGIALLLVATMSPFTLLRLVPAMEAGAVAQLESTRHRLQGAARAPVRGGGNLALDLARGGSSSLDPQDVARTVGTAGAPGSEGGSEGGGAIPMVAGSAVAPEVVLAGVAAGAATSTVKDTTARAMTDVASVSGPGDVHAGAARDDGGGVETGGVAGSGSPTEGDAGAVRDARGDARYVSRVTPDDEDG
jgi:hypothetical protein